MAPAEQAAFNDCSTELLDAAKSMPVDEFARHCQLVAKEASADDGLSDLERLRQRRSISRRVDRETGMVITRITLDPVTDERLLGAINRETRRKVAAAGQPTGTESWEHASVDSLVDLVTGPTSPASTAPTPAAGATPAAPQARTLLPLPPRTIPVSPTMQGPPLTIRVRRRQPVVRRWRHACLTRASTSTGVRCATRPSATASCCETAGGIPLPIATVRRMCCDANIFPIVIDGAGGALDVGRSSRLATPDQRRALSAMYTTCGYPGCHVPFEHCQIHHVTDWTRHRGPTDLANLLPLCAKHHHLVHEGGWTLHLRPDRTITLTRPDGQVHFQGQPQPADPSPPRGDLRPYRPPDSTTASSSPATW